MITSWTMKDASGLDAAAVVALCDPKHYWRYFPPVSGQGQRFSLEPRSLFVFESQAKTWRVKFGIILIVHLLFGS